MLTLATLALFAACTEDDSEAEYTGGTFAVTIEDVKDNCYDGTFSLIFMPEGEPTDFAAPMELPAMENLPADATLDLQDPFSAMSVTWEAGVGEDQLVIVDAAQGAVLLDEDSYGNCTVDMTINVTVDVIDADTISASAILNTAGFEDAECPVIEEDPCDIELVLSGINTAANADQ
jgi:hypothetical protein